MKEKLKKLRLKTKFSDFEWEERGLNPSNEELCLKMETLLNNCLDEIIILIEKNESKQRIKKTLKKGLSSFDSREFDTEEKEFICDYFFEISKIIELDIKNDLNSWLYGKGLNFLLKLTDLFKKPEKIIDTISKECSSCKATLDVYILEKKSNIDYSSFNIVKCKNCKEYNLLEFGKGIKECRFGEFELTEQLSKDDFNLEQAETRLKQIKHFRK